MAGSLGLVALYTYKEEVVMAIHVRQLTDRERTALQGLRDSRQTNTTTALRASIILLSDQGWHVPQIAKKVLVHEHSVRTRIKRFNAQGLAALRDLPRSGRPSKKK